MAKAERESLNAAREWDEWLTLFANRNEVAEEYAVMLQCAAADWIGWPLVNGSIVRRWSASGLEYIKRRAWKIAVEGEG